jgi:hypothetical protein
VSWGTAATRWLLYCMHTMHIVQSAVSLVQHSVVVLAFPTRGRQRVLMLQQHVLMLQQHCMACAT